MSGSYPFVVLLVSGILLGVLVILAAVFVPIVVISRRRKLASQAFCPTPLSDAQTASLSGKLTQCEANGESTVLPPTPCIIRRGHLTKPSGRAALTTARLLWQWRTDAGEILLRELRGIAEASAYNGESRYGVSWIVLSYAGQELGLGFQTGEHSRWLALVRSRLGDGLH